jgi:hypothetical protein
MTLDHDSRRDPKRLLPLSDVKALGFGVETQRELEKIFRDYPDIAPPILKISGRNYIVAADRDRCRDALIEHALREACEEKQRSRAALEAPVG